MPINFGSTEIGDLKLGINQVDAVYLGTTKIWPEDAPPSGGYYGISHDFFINGSSMYSALTVPGEYVSATLPADGDLSGPPWWTNSTPVEYNSSGLFDNNANGSQLGVPIQLSDTNQEDSLALDVDFKLLNIYEREITYGVRGQEATFPPQTITLTDSFQDFSPLGYPTLYMKMSPTDNSAFSTYLSLVELVYGTGSEIPFFITFGNENGDPPVIPPADPGYTYVFQSNLIFSVFLYDTLNPDSTSDLHMLEQLGCTGISVGTTSGLQFQFGLDSSSNTWATGWTEMEIEFVNQTTGTWPVVTLEQSDFQVTSTTASVVIPFTSILGNNGIPQSSNGNWLDLAVRFR